MKKFPENDIMNALKSWWDRKRNSPFLIKTPNFEETGGTVFDVQPDVSSVQAVGVVAKIDSIVGFKIKPGEIIKPGGYRSYNEFIGNILPRIRARFNSHYNISTKIQTTKTVQGVMGAHAG